MVVEEEEEGENTFAIDHGEQEEMEVEALLLLEGNEMYQTFQTLDLNLVLPPPSSLVSSQNSLPSHPTDCLQAVNQEGSHLERSWMTIFYSFALQADKETEIHISS